MLDIEVIREKSVPDENLFVRDPEALVHEHEPVLEHQDVEKAQRITGVVADQPVHQQTLSLVVGEEEPKVKGKIRSFVYCKTPIRNLFT